MFPIPATASVGVTEKEQEEAPMRLSPVAAYIIGGVVLGVVLLACCIAAGIILVYKKRSTPENRESTLLRVDRMKRLSLNLSSKHPLKMLVR